MSKVKKQFGILYYKFYYFRDVKILKFKDFSFKLPKFLGLKADVNRKTLR